jgi:tRNA dimethylallyltransferase
VSLRPKAVLIAGPTASGKSAAALSLASALHGTVINADSVQTYSELAILTTRPTGADMKLVPHRLYGIVPASQAYSVGNWLADAATAIAEAQGEGRVPILVGGTGLYFKALTRGLAPIPPVPADIRAAVREQIGRAHV